MNVLEQNNSEPSLTCESLGEGEELTALDDETLAKLATEFLMERAQQENPLMEQYSNMFSEWEAMMESYRQEELMEQLAQDAE